MTTELAQAKPASLLEQLAGTVGLEPTKYYEAIKSACGCKGATDAHFMTLLMQASKLGLDPVSKHLYLMPTKAGVQVVIGADGYVKLMLAHPDYLAHTVEADVKPDGTIVSATCTIWTRKRKANDLPPYVATEYFVECRTNGGPWRSHPVRMLKHRAVGQAVRGAFGTYMPDEQEWERAAEVASGALPDKPADALSALTASLVENDEPLHVDATVTAEVHPEYDAEESRALDALDNQ
ncbi:MAG: recombinase RecT [Mycobacterium sp.]